MIARFIAHLAASIKLRIRIMGLRADIVGYQEDIDTIWILKQQGSMAHMLIAERLGEAQTELYACISRLKELSENNA